MVIESGCVNLCKFRIMGVINVTPDSFSDGGQFIKNGRINTDSILRTVDSMLVAGADIIDVGGESTRPGADPVGVDHEVSRVVPVLELIRTHFDTLLSVDTSSAKLIREAVSAGANFINDVRALRRPGALEAAVESKLPVCLTHMQNQPKNMQIEPFYLNVVSDVLTFLLERKDACLAAGMAPDKIYIDPGFGFGKTLEHNVTLFRAIDRFVDTGFPVIVGVSRKRMISELLNDPSECRLIGSVTLAVLAAQRGVSILRVHDVDETVRAIKILSQIDF